MASSEDAHEIDADDRPGRGRIVVVATPIGNLEDLSERARRALEEADLVACEDTRHTGRLLAHLGVKRRMISLHEHNERRRVPQLVEQARDGAAIALVSDAGTPLVSDPGFLLVREAAKEGVRIEPIPGPSAVMAALVASALPPHPFTFCGFPPPRSGKRKTFFGRFAPLGHTVVFFESPHRIVRSLADAVEVFGPRPAAVCRELTKRYEEIVRGPLDAVLEQLAARPSIKGELVVVVGPPD